MKPVFIDTSAFYALADGDDYHHVQAVESLDDLLDRQELVSSDYVLVETRSLLQRRLGTNAADTFWSSLRTGLVSLMGVEGEDLDRAWRIRADWPAAGFSLVDLCSFAMIERLGIATAFAFDRHFRIIRLGERRRQALQVIPGPTG